MLSKIIEKQWKKKLWLRYETISDGKIMEKSRNYDKEIQ